MRIPYRFEITAFVSGMVVMILELVGARILAPYVGASLFVWTNIIGIILASLSIGYWFGGKISNRHINNEILSLIIIYSALFCSFTTFYYDQLAVIFFDMGTSVKIAALILSFLLFAPSTFILGIISPFLVRLKVNSITKTGAVVGNLYALSTIGSIAGTFLTGYLLLSYLGSYTIMLSLITILILLSFVAYSAVNYMPRLVIIFLIIVLYFFSQKIFHVPNNRIGKAILIRDTAYSRVAVIDKKHEETQRPIRYLFNNNLTNSAMYLDSKDSELVFPYDNIFTLSYYFNPSLKTALQLGGGAYSFPKYIVNNHPDTSIDVVEIDPELTSIAEQYFNLKETPHMNIYHEDARTFINSLNKKYDAIFIDVFSTLSPPFYLITKEVVEKLDKTITSNGVVMMNIISSVEGEKGKLLRAYYYTFKEVFPTVYIVPTKTNDGYTPQNVVLIALKSTYPDYPLSENPKFQRYLSGIWKKPIKQDAPILKDDFAPVEFLAKFML